MDTISLEHFIYEKLKNELPNNLYYHSIHHVEDVLAAAIEIAGNEAVTEYQLQLIKVAVLFHDSGFTKGAIDHEISGCDIAWEILPNYGFSANQIQSICAMIMATKIPQTPINLMEEIICDADLDYLGRDDYDSISNNLFKEISMYRFMDEIDWLRLQVKFLEAHRYFTKTAIRLRKEHKDKKLSELKIKLITLTTRANR